VHDRHAQVEGQAGPQLRERRQGCTGAVQDALPQAHHQAQGLALDRIATLKLLQVGGKTAGAAIAELGFEIEQGSDQFFVERAQQAARSASEAQPGLRSRR
jgi:hypothetical protein